MEDIDISKQDDTNEYKLTHAIVKDLWSIKYNTAGKPH